MKEKQTTNGYTGTNEPNVLMLIKLPLIRHSSSFVLPQVKIVQVLLSKYCNSVCPEDLAILTPYTAQKELIKRKLSNETLKVKVQTITESQGVSVCCVT